MFDLDAWQERAAIMEYDGGMSRFAAETEAAKLQGATRWQMIKLAQEGRQHEDGKRNPEPERHRRKATEWHLSDDLPTMQPDEEEQARSMPERVFLV